jgi:hypothetical protein
VAFSKTLFNKSNLSSMEDIQPITKKAVRTETLRFRLTPDEHKLVMGEFKAMGISTSVFFRQNLLPIFYQQAKARNQNG